MIDRRFGLAGAGATAALALVTACMPYKMHVQRVVTDLNHPWLTGYRQGLFRGRMLAIRRGRRRPP